MFCLSASDCLTDTIWHDIEDFFTIFATRTGEVWPSQVRDGAARSDLQIWGLQDAEKVHFVAVTELSDTPRGYVCTVRIASGAAPKPLQERLLDEIGRWARQMGCVAVRIVGRRGWLRRFPRFKPTAVVMEWNL